jgi:hypothetical protein
MRRMAKWFALSGLSVWCTACGGGGGSGGGSPPPPAAEFSLSTTSMSFVSTQRFAATDPQPVTATVDTSGAGTLYIIVKIAGDAVKSVDNFAISNSTSGSANVNPQDASKLTPGTHQSTLTVTACLNSPDCSSGQLRGSPQNIAVSYNVQTPTVQGNIVAPRIAISNLAGDVIIRGANFSGVTSVSFGATAAASFSVTSTTEIHASYPPLAAGTYAISINGGAIPFSASLAVTDPQPYTAAALAYPGVAPTPGYVDRPKYDAERKTIYVVLKDPVQGSNNRLVSYTFSNGAWGSPQVAAIPDLYDVALGPSGAFLYGWADLSILEIDPATLAINATYPTPAILDLGLLPYFIKGLSSVNDGYAIVSLGFSGTGAAPLYMFSTRDHTFTPIWADTDVGSPNLDNRDHVDVSADGATALVGSVYSYQPSTDDFILKVFTHGYQNNNQPPPVLMDNKATRFSLSGIPDQNGPNLWYTEVYDVQYNLLGRISEPASMTPPIGDMLGAVSPDGTRDYVLHVDFTQNAVTAFSVYDIGPSTPGTGFAQIGATVAVPPMAMTRFDAGVATVTPDGKTLLVGADNFLFVQPVP